MSQTIVMPFNPSEELALALVIHLDDLAAEILAGLVDAITREQARRREGQAELAALTNKELNDGPPNSIRQPRKARLPDPQTPRPRVRAHPVGRRVGRSYPLVRTTGRHTRASLAPGHEGVNRWGVRGKVVLGVRLLAHPVILSPGSQGRHAELRAWH